MPPKDHFCPTKLKSALHQSFSKPCNEISYHHLLNTRRQFREEKLVLAVNLTTIALPSISAGDSGSTNFPLCYCPIAAVTAGLHCLIPWQRRFPTLEHPAPGEESCQTPLLVVWKMQWHDDCILGMDFLSYYHTILNLAANTLCLGKTNITLSTAAPGRQMGRQHPVSIFPSLHPQWCQPPTKQCSPAPAQLQWVQWAWTWSPAEAATWIWGHLCCLQQRLHSNQLSEAHYWCWWHPTNLSPPLPFSTYEESHHRAKGE